MRFLTVLASVTAIVALVVAPVVAQTTQPAPSPYPARPAPAAPGAQPAEPKTKEVEGTVKKVDAAAKTLHVSAGLLGLFGAALEVTGDTKIQVEGKSGSFADIHEGAKVKASYETHDGKNIAKSIEVMAAEQKADSPARPAPPAIAPGGGAPVPSSEQPKTQ